MVFIVRSARNIGFLWLAVVLLMILSVAILLPVDPNDYWWYVRLGKDILAAGSVPAVDLYSSTQAGQPFIYHSWLSAVVFWLTYQAGDITLTVLLRALLLLLFFGMIWVLAQMAGAGPRLAAIITLAVALVSSNHWAMRPQLFSYPLFSLTLIALWQWQRGHNRWVWALPFIMIVWVNVHGAYVLVILLSGAALIGGGGDRKSLASGLAAALFASLVNPHLAGAWTYLPTAILNPTARMLGTEWHPPVPDTWQNTIFFMWLLSFPILAYYAKAKMPTTQWLWFLGIGWMALNGLRYVVWFAAILGLATTILIGPLLDIRKYPGRSEGPLIIHLSIFAALILLPLALLPGIRERWWSQVPPALSSDTPVEAVAWLADHPDLPGPMWSNIASASYVIFALPERPVWADTRLELYPAEQWDRYLAVSGATYNWQDILDGEGINLVMANQSAQRDLIQALRESDTWAAAYEDEITAIFTRQSD